MKKNFFGKSLAVSGIAAMALLIVSVFTLGHAEGDPAGAERLIKERVPCDQITEDQLEGIGDYLMEQMHPGELHELMDERMGGEGSDTLHKAHVRMAESLYCGKSSFGTGFSGMMNGGMMGMMNMMSGGMMGGMGGMGMMNMMGGGMMGQTGNGYGMMSSGSGSGMFGKNNEEVGTMMGFGYGMTGGSVLGWSLYSLLYTAIIAFVFGIMFWWTYKLIVKPRK